MTNQATRGQGILESFLSRQRAQLADARIPSALRQGRILDLGCGSQPYFLSQIKFQEKYGLDPVVDTSFSTAINLLPQAFVGSPLPFEDGFFNVVTILAVSEHIDPAQFKILLSEVFRVLGPEGRLILTTPAPWSDAILQIMTRLNLVSREEIAEHVNYLSIKQLTNLCVVAGFELSKIKAGYFELGLNQWVYAEK